MSRPSLESLRILEACVSAGSFSRAAGRLALSPAAVSLRIRTLEAELGEPLFLRHGPRVTPTAKAADLSARVRRGLDEIEGALEAFRAATPPLRVTAPPTFAARWLAPRLSLYEGADIELDVSTDVRAANAFDVAVRTGCGAWPGFEAHRLSPVQLTPMLAPSLVASGALLSPHDLRTFTLLPHPGWERWFMAALGTVPAGLRFAAVDYPTHELNAAAACAGEGVALLPPAFYEPLARAGALVAPFDCVLTGPDWHFALVRAGDLRPEPRRFCAWLRGQHS
jgi:LysR family transcriptional regulator, glycine cleavage system transcriptional activator